MACLPVLLCQNWSEGSFLLGAGKVHGFAFHCCCNSGE